MNASFTAVVFGDTHFPFQDDRALKACLQIVKAVKPDAVVHVGDLLDCYQISDYDKDPLHPTELNDDIKCAKSFLADVRAAAPKAELTLLEGNHEDRLRRAIWRASGPMREIAKLSEFQHGLSWPSIFSLRDMGWRFVGLNDQSKATILPKIIVKHGTAINKWSAFTAKQEWMKYGRSGISGHTHRLGAFYHRDHNGRSVWLESGCTCSLDPVYCDDPDWQQGAVVLTWSADRKVMGERVVGIRKGEYVL